MKKIVVLIIIFAVVVTMNQLKDKEQIGMVIINQEKIPDLSLRQSIKSCLDGEKGHVTEEVAVTLYADDENMEKYRALMERLEGWGIKCTLRKETKENIFDFRALGELSLYIWEGEAEDIYEAFLTRNAVFYSTGFVDYEYDRFFSEGEFERAREYLLENICIVEA